MINELEIQGGKSIIERLIEKPKQDPGAAKEIRQRTIDDLSNIRLPNQTPDQTPEKGKR